jgi:hypothetical protein
MVTLLPLPARLFIIDQEALYSKSRKTQRSGSQMAKFGSHVLGVDFFFHCIHLPPSVKVIVTKF